MHDDAALTVGRVTRVLNERVRPAVHPARVPLYVSAHDVDGEPIPPAEALAAEYRPFEVGTPWGPAWSTTWFRLTGQVPAEWAGRRVEALVDLGFDVNMTGFQCEALAYRPDGTPIKSLNPRNQWLPVTDAADGGELVDLYLEAAANPVLLDYHPFLPTQQGDVLTASREPLYRVRHMDLAVFDPEVFELAADLDVLLELQAQLPETGPRRMRILQALDDALDELDLQRIAETASAARACLVDVLAAPAEHSAHHVSAIGHAHIDSAWLWPVRETIRKVARTTSSMASLIDDEPEFVYGMSSAQQYAWIKQHRPEVYERVRQAVASGRFVPLGGMWVESDTVMPTGESLVRQFLYGQRFFQREFGMRCRGVWLPDSFGYSPALPQLMRRAGFEWFFTQKISWNQRNRFPHHTFEWEGIDGSRVFTHFPPMDTYNSQLSGAELALATRQFAESRTASGSIAPVGWGDGGGGTTREMTARAKRVRDLEGSATVTWEKPDDFFERARAELPDAPVWVGELYLELHRGTLTSQHQTKALHRRAEHALVEAELWCATAAVREGAQYPYDELDRLWEQVLLHEFHDILPGTSIAWVHREAVAVLSQVLADAWALADTARRALAGEGDVALEFVPTGLGWAGARAALNDGRAGGESAGADGPAARAALSGGQEATADASGALGARRVTAPQGVASLTPVGDGWVLENAHVRVTVSGQGLITSAVDVASGREAIAPGQAANLLQLHQDFPNMWDAWDIDRFYRNRVTDLDEVAEMRASVDDGVARVQVDRAFSQSTVRQTIELAPDARTVVLRTRVDWHETEKLLKLAFPLDVFAAATVAETQFGHQSRVTHVNTSWEAAKFETSMHRYVLVQEPGFGVALVNDSVYGYDTTRDATDDGVTTTVRLSLLRAPRFPDPETDHGVHEITAGLVVGADVALATEEGLRLNTPSTVVRGAHEVTPLVHVAGDGLVVSSVKLAADRSGDVIVRVYEALGRRAAGVLTVHMACTGVREVSLIEDDLPETGSAAGAAVGALGAGAGAAAGAPGAGAGAAAAVADAAGSGAWSGSDASCEVPLTLRPFEVRTLRISR
ncbi:alpha-mannosidase [Microbacterium luticocti]|uniref:alpha-mannosidase n=1 Tax=Microbacterium luticocti TaxID=451764 RepID=UPI000411B67E|nr:glycoside hydrolase family 38 C-terminal domain-containing protein [Microbacterium luticocti]